MNDFIELNRKDGKRFMFCPSSGWEIHDCGDEPAWWVNHTTGRNLDCKNTYEKIRINLGVKR